MTLEAVKAVANQLDRSEKAELVNYIVASLVEESTLESEANQLIHKIKHGGPNQTVVERHDELLRKSVRGEMTNLENEELQKLVPEFDRWAVERARMMVRLATLWKVTLEEVMEQLTIKNPGTVYSTSQMC